MIPKCCLNLRKGARGRMKATPLTIKGKVEAYTGTRSSKVGKCQLAYKKYEGGVSIRKPETSAGKPEQNRRACHSTQTHRREDGQ